ncbi:MAG: glycosyltransferase family 4 protein [Candidatus Methanodesulfokora washburnensis]
MKVLFLTPYILGDPRTPGSSTEVRVYPLAKELEKYGILCNFLTPSPTYTLNPFERYIFPYSLFDLFRLYDYTEKFDIIFISRISSFLIHFIEKKWKEKRKKVIFDLDDPLYLPTRKILGLKVRSPSFSHIEKVMKDSDVVTVSSHSILSYVKNFNSNSFLIHTPIDTEVFNPLIKKKSEKFTIGWIGHAYGHLVNLKMLRYPLMRLGEQYDIRFKIISYLGYNAVKRTFKEVEKFVEVDYGPDYWIPFEKLPKYISDFDVLASPLIKSSWFEGKSAIRVATGMAMGIPVIASPVGEQKYIIKHEINGFLARNEEEWYNYLKILIEDENLRKRIGREGRNTAESELSLEANGKKLYGIIHNLNFQ